MTYIYMPWDGEIQQTIRCPSSQEIESIIDGELSVLRVDDKGTVTQLTPIDSDDCDSWSDIPIMF